MSKKQIKASKHFHQVVRLILGTYLKYAFRVKWEGLSEVKQLTAPYVLLGNHTNFWDPFLVASPITQPVHFVTSDEYFRSPILKWLLGLVGAIPKMKFVSDSETVKDIIRVRKQNGIVGIFPEGRRNWDGKTLEILFPTAKLIKSLNVPVVIALLQGAALSFPRWAKKARKGKLTVTYTVLLTADEVAALSAEAIYERICQALAFDEYVYQAQRMIPFKGNGLAEHLELFLFSCPHCHTMGEMESKDDQFFCRQCGYRVRYNSYGYFELVNQDHLYFTNPRDWNEWQMVELRGQIQERKKLQDATPILSEDPVLVMHGGRMQPLESFSMGRINLYPDRFQFVSSEGEELVFLIDDLNGANIQHNDRFEFYHEKILYRFTFQIPHTSAYKWVQALRILQEDGQRKMKVSL